MVDIAYHLAVIIIAALGILRGFRRRLSRQAASCTGMAIASVCCYIFRDPVREWILANIPAVNFAITGSFVVSTLAGAAIYVAFYNVFRFATAPLSLIFRRKETGILDNICGAVYGLLRYLIWVSMLLNLIVCFKPGSRLADYARHDDGDIVHEVMLISPFFTGSENIDDLSHRLQLDEASRIS